MATVRAKVRNYTKAEWDALNEKMKNPEQEALCPRCGNEIEYEEIGNSISVYCRSEDCIFGGIRGL
jgi:formamidopyrimidine-DNA glycosylase